MNLIKKLTAIISICAAIASPACASAQEIIEIDPLFQYPSAPEELSSIQDKSNYLVNHFWEPMDFKDKKAVDQNALNDAFKVYCVPMRWADKERALVSVDKLIEKISKNPTLLIQFTKAAEENLYSPRADVWIDEVYLRFLNAIVKTRRFRRRENNIIKPNSRPFKTRLSATRPRNSSLLTPTAKSRHISPCRPSP